MKATSTVNRTTTAASVVTINVAMSLTEATELRHQMLAFWRGVAVSSHPRGESPFAALYAQIDKTIEHEEKLAAVTF